MKLFVDSCGWIELSNKHSINHGKVKLYYYDFLRKKGRVYTSDYVLNETISLTFRRLPFDSANRFLTFLEQSIVSKELLLERISEQRFEKAIELRRKYRDKPRISFTDLTSMVVMSELGIADVLTEDKHFRQVGLGFNKVP